MFWNEKQDSINQKLLARIEALEARVYELERKDRIIFGEFNPSLRAFFTLPAIETVDKYQKIPNSYELKGYESITVNEAIYLLLHHFGIEFYKTPEIRSTTTIKKIEKVKK